MPLRMAWGSRPAHLDRPAEIGSRSGFALQHLAPLCFLLGRWPDAPQQREASSCQARWDAGPQPSALAQPPACPLQGALPEAHLHISVS